MNGHRPDAVEAARETAAWLREKEIKIGAEPDTAKLLGVDSVSLDEIPQGKMVVSFGGDGTLIRAAHLCSRRGTPVLGVYFGRFGFVTQVVPNETIAAIRSYLDGEAQLDERTMVRAELKRQDRTVATLHSLNEITVQRSTNTRMLTFDVSVNGRQVARYPADGVLVATPTGSTAYNLSAGGPVIDPDLDAMVLTPIMPHTLSTRPLVLPATSSIDIDIESRGDAVLSCDGQSRLHMLSGDSVTVARSERTTRLVSINPHDFLDKLSERLLWSKSPKMEDAP